MQQRRVQGGKDEIKRFDRRMGKLTEVFWESVPKSWNSID